MVKLFSGVKGAGLYIPKTITIVLVEKPISNEYRQYDLIGIVFILRDKFFQHYGISGVFEVVTAPCTLGSVDATKSLLLRFILLYC